jgi:hypothetical protein
MYTEPFSLAVIILSAKDSSDIQSSFDTFLYVIVVSLDIIMSWDMKGRFVKRCVATGHVVAASDSLTST